MLDHFGQHFFHVDVAARTAGSKALRLFPGDACCSLATS